MPCGAVVVSVSGVTSRRCLRICREGCAPKLDSKVDCAEFRPTETEPDGRVKMSSFAKMLVGRAGVGVME